MTNQFQVSVIIPVYNAEKFLRKAVESAVHLTAVGEVILIEDKSPDNALEICKEMEKQFDKVKFFQHPNGENRGAGASRNLGIEKATCDYIAFLDADDWYLPNRFETEKEIFKNSEIDGVYGATGFYLEGDGLIDNKLTTFKLKIPSEDLLYSFVSLRGRFTTNAITVRKKLFKKTGVLNTSLVLHQDTHLWYRLAYFGKLVPGDIEKAIAVRRVHAENRITNKSNETRGLFHKAVFNDFIKYKTVDKRAMRIIVNRYVHSVSSNPIKKMVNYLSIFLRHPRIIKIYL